MRFLLRDLSSVIPALAFLRPETKSLTIFIQKPDDNAPDAGSRAMRSANEHFFHAIPAARCYFPDEIERIDGGNKRPGYKDVKGNILPFCYAFALSSVSLSKRDTRTTKDASYIFALYSQQEWPISLFPFFVWLYLLHPNIPLFLSLSLHSMRSYLSWWIWHEGVSFIIYYRIVLVLSSQVGRAQNNEIGKFLYFTSIRE